MARQLLVAGGGVLVGTNPMRRIRKALRLLSVAPAASAGMDRAVLDVAFRAVRLPALTQDAAPTCLFVTFADDGRPWPHVLRRCADLRRLGLKVVMIAVTDRPDLDCADPGPQVVDALVVRANHGYDFAAWAATLRYLPELWAAPELWFVNDSVYHARAALDAVARRVHASGADVVALTESCEIAPHFQSYFFVLRRSALDHAAVRAFWAGMASKADKVALISDYEVGQRGMMEAAGLTLDLLFPAAPGDAANLLHHGWRDLLTRGFPFVKVQLLRDNPYEADLSGWRDTLAAHGFDVPEIAFHLGARPSGAAALLEMH